MFVMKGYCKIEKSLYVSASANAISDSVLKNPACSIPLCTNFFLFQTFYLLHRLNVCGDTFLFKPTLPEGICLNGITVYRSCHDVVP